MTNQKILHSPEPLDEGGSPASPESLVASFHQPPPPEREDEGLRARWEAILRDTESDHARELADRERKAAEWESAFKSALRERELATQLAGRPLLPGAASQLIKLWRDEFEVVADSGSHHVRSRDGRTVEQAVGEWLSAPEYAHFRQPMTRGGTSARGSNPAGAPGRSAAASPPKTLGEAVLQRWRESMDRTPGAGLDVPRPPRRLGR